MSICSDVARDCRVDLPRISTMNSKGDECAIVPGKVGDLGSKVFTTPYNVVYQRPGVTIREFNHEGLRLPQKRSFLGPEFFNSGCATLYGNSRFNQGPNSANESTDTSAMFDYAFATRPYFESSAGGAGPCYCAGAKCSDPVNSFIGWNLDKDGQLGWKSKNQNAMMQQCGGGK